MERRALSYLQKWLISADRKPLVLRGARQVGKTWLVRHFAKTSHKVLIELNFEKQPQLADLFSSNDPKKILFNLSAEFQQEFTTKNSLLFLDEIQAAPMLFSRLRWFSEELPELPVIAAGSLLEFLLSEHTFSMPVGRISYMHLEPLSFEEFLLANHKKMLCDYLSAYDLETEIPTSIHEQLMSYFKLYVLVGGLPAAVASWVKENSLSEVNRIHYELLGTYRDDFAKYRGRIAIERLHETITAVPDMLGQKFVMRRVNPDAQTQAVRHALSLLEKARVCHRVSSVAGNGVPLAAEMNPKYFKEIFLDVGLCNTALRLNFQDINIDEIILIHQGGIAEQVVGQLLRTIEPFYVEPALYYWLREEKNSNAEIDYLIQHGHQVVPIEVKSGSTGGLKSLHLFMELKQLSLAVRVNSDFPSKTHLHVKNHVGVTVQYQLLSIPFYLLEQIGRLLRFMRASI